MHCFTLPVPGCRDSLHRIAHDAQPLYGVDDAPCRINFTRQPHRAAAGPGTLPAQYTYEVTLPCAGGPRAGGWRRERHVLRLAPSGVWTCSEAACRTLPPSSFHAALPAEGGVVARGGPGRTDLPTGKRKRQALLVPLGGPEAPPPSSAGPAPRFVDSEAQQATATSTAAHALESLATICGLEAARAEGRLAGEAAAACAVVGLATAPPSAAAAAARPDLELSSSVSSGGETLEDEESHSGTIITTAPGTTQRGVSAHTLVASCSSMQFSDVVLDSACRPGPGDGELVGDGAEASGKRPRLEPSGPDAGAADDAEPAVECPRATEHKRRMNAGG